MREGHRPGHAGAKVARSGFDLDRPSKVFGAVRDVSNAKSTRSSIVDPAPVVDDGEREMAVGDDKRNSCRGRLGMSLDIGEQLGDGWDEVGPDRIW